MELDEPTLERFVRASQATQAEALKFFIETFRSGMWRRTGIIWWNIADGWPQFSDAVIDYYGVRKAAFDVVRRSQLPVCLIVREARDGRREIVVSNLERGATRVDFEVVDADDGAIVLAGAAECGGDSVQVVGRIPADPGESRCLGLRWTWSGGSGRSHHLAGDAPFDLDTYLGWLDRLGLPGPS